MKRSKKLPLIILVLLTLGATAGAQPLQTVATFDPNTLEAPEDVYVDVFGNSYVTLALTGQVIRVTPNGQKTLFVALPMGAAPMTPCYTNSLFPLPALLGIDRDVLGNFYFTLRSCEPGKSGVWKTGPTGGNLHQIASVPDGTMLNGLDVTGTSLYAADTFGGRIWKLNLLTNQIAVWSADPLLALRPDAVFPGPNGLKRFGNSVYVSQSDSATIVRIPIKLNGSASPGVVHATLGAPGGVGCDNFDFDTAGNLYCGTDPFNTVLKVTPTGQVTTLFTAADGLDGPTATRFGKGPNGRQYLYVTNAAFPFFSTTLKPSLMRVRLDSACGED